LTERLPILTILHRLTWLIQAVVLLCLAAGCGRSSQQQSVLDPDNILSRAEKSHLTQQHQALLRDLDIDFFLVISADPLPEIRREADKLFTTFSVGQSSSQDKGVLLLVDPFRQQVRMEISYSLEATFPDSFVGYIQRRQMLPFFQSGKIGRGIEAAVELLVSRAMAQDSGEKFAPLKEIGPEFLSGGAGTDTGYSSDSIQPLPDTGRPQVPAQSSPEAALAAYKQLLADHNKRPDLELYTPESRAFFSRWTITDGQFDNVLRTLGGNEPELIITLTNRAVIRYPVNQRQLSPFFLRKGERGWMFDFATMHKCIGFNHKNQWHFPTTDHPYMFGFSKIRFDGNGFPFKDASAQ
jgi:hypothetical protein